MSSSATSDGYYSPFTTVDIAVTQQKTIIDDDSGTKDKWYKIQWKNSQTGKLSDFSEPVTVESYSPSSVAPIIFSVLTAMGISTNDRRIGVPFCLSAVNDARKFTAAKLYGIRHAWQQKFEHPIALTVGVNSVPLPEDIDFIETDRSVLAARFKETNLTYIDKRTWNSISSDMVAKPTHFTVYDNRLVFNSIIP